MSGGSWDYFCYKLDDVWARLVIEKCPYRRALGRQLEKASKALHDIEWVDSRDYGPGDEMEAIKTAIGGDVPALAEMIREAREVQESLDRMIQAAQAEAEKRNGEGV